MAPADGGGRVLPGGKDSYMAFWRFALLGLAATLICGSTAYVGADEIGDVVYCEQFEDGEPFTFTSDHVYAAPPAATNGSGSPLWATLSYTVDSNPINWHQYWASYGDHTSGSGNMMIVNAADVDLNCSVTVWQGPMIPVALNTDYTISYWVALSIQDSPPMLMTSVNGVEIGTFDADIPTELDTNGTWYKVSYTWNSGLATTMQIRLCDTATVYQGDDYALDDICVTRAPCWAQETAWTAGTRYVSKGSWATFTQYAPDHSVELLGGQDGEAGSVHFSAAVDGTVTITITLNTGWRFLDDPENVKVQGYGAAPTSKPSPGLFANKAHADGSPFSIEVDAAAFYGVHVSVERRYTCE
jgi:hypothetical protein